MKSPKLIALIVLIASSAASAETYRVGPATLTVTGSTLKLHAGGELLAEGSTQTATLKITQREGYLILDLDKLNGEPPNYIFGLFSTTRDPRNSPKRVGSVIAGEDIVFGLLPMDWTTFPEMATGEDGVYVKSPRYLPRKQRFALYCCKADKIELTLLLDEIQRTNNLFRSAIMRLNPINGEPTWFLMPDGGGGDRPKPQDIIAVCKEMNINHVVLSSGFWQDVTNPNHPSEPYGWNGVGDPRALNITQGWSAAEFIKALDEAGISVCLHMTGVHQDPKSAMVKLYPGQWRNSFSSDGDVAGKLTPTTTELAYQIGVHNATGVIKVARYGGRTEAIKGVYQDTLDVDDGVWNAGMSAAYVQGFTDTLMKYGYQLEDYSTGIFRWMDSYLGFFDWKTFDSRTGRTLLQSIAHYPEGIDPWGLVQMHDGWFNIGHMFCPDCPNQQRWAWLPELNAWLYLPTVKGFSMSYSEWIEIKTKPERRDLYKAIQRWNILRRWPTKQVLITALMRGEADGQDIQAFVNSKMGR